MGDENPQAGARRARLLRAVVLLSAGSAGGLTFLTLGMPAGAVVGSALGAMGVNFLSPGERLPRPISNAGRITLGAVVGLSFGPDLLVTIGESLVPIAIGTLLLTAAGALVGVVLHFTFGWDVATALYASAPGGLGEVTSTAEDVGARVEYVAAVHTVRIAVVVIVGPPLLSLISGLWPA